MNSAEFSIVGIGASAGGIEAFHSFFKHLPADCGMAFVTILHLPPSGKSMLSDILSRWTTMPVVDAWDGVRIEPNHVYVPPPTASSGWWMDISALKRRTGASAFFGLSTPSSTP